MYKVWHWGPFLYILDIWVLFNFQWNLTLKLLPWYHYDCGVQVFFFDMLQRKRSQVTYFIHFYPFSTQVRFICSELPPVNKLNYNSWRHLQFMGALCRFVHPMSLLQQLKEFLHWDSWVRRASQGEDLPQQHPVRPPEHTHTTTHTQTQWIQMRGQTAWSSQRWERGFRVPKINQWICLGKYWSSIMFTATNLRINLTFLLSGKVKSILVKNQQLFTQARNETTPQKEMEDGFFFVSWIKTLELTVQVGIL